MLLLLDSLSFSLSLLQDLEQETEEVKQNHQEHSKEYSSPKGGSGATLQTPNIFQLQYVKGNGRPQGFLHDLKLCALQTVSVNYTGDGNYATYYDGTPVSMTMDIEHSKNLTPVYATKIMILEIIETE